MVLTGSAYSRFLGNRIKKLLLVSPRNERNSHGYMMGRIESSSYHPAATRNTCLLCHDHQWHIAVDAMIPDGEFLIREAL